MKAVALIPLALLLVPGAAAQDIITLPGPLEAALEEHGEPVWSAGDALLIDTVDPLLVDHVYPRTEHVEDEAGYEETAFAAFQYCMHQAEDWKAQQECYALRAGMSAGCAGIPFFAWQAKLACMAVS